MKTQKIVLITTVALSCASLPVWSQSEMSDVVESTSDRDEAQVKSTRTLGDLRRANQIIGQELKDSHDESIGKVRDLALDLQNGRVAAVIVATGGMIGMNEHLVAVPPETFICDRTTQALRFKGEQEQLKNAPEFRPSEWKNFTDQASLRQAYQRFGVETYFAPELPKSIPDLLNQRGQASQYYSFNGQNALPRLGYVSRAETLLGLMAKNQQEEKLGTVNNLVLDLEAGRIVEVILAEGGFLGMQRELSAVPPQAFHWNADNSSLTLNTTREAFQAAPHFKSAQWGYAYEPDSILAIYRNYKVMPYFATTGLENGAQNVRERTDDGVTALEQGNAEDVKLTDQIRQAIQSNGAISVDAGNVKIITVDGKVTLRGMVQTQDVKQRIADTAAKFVSADKMDNQIVVIQSRQLAQRGDGALTRTAGRAARLHQRPVFTGGVSDRATMAAQIHGRILRPSTHARNGVFCTTASFSSPAKLKARIYEQS